MRQQPVHRRPVRLRPSMVVAAGLVGGIALPAMAWAADTYPVKLDRTFRVGQTFTVTTKADVSQVVTVTANGQPQPGKNEKFSAELAGTEKVEAINAKTGDPTRVTLTIDKLTKDGAEVMPAGSVVVADHTGEKESFTVGGADVEPEKAAVLSAVLDVARGDDASGDDAVLGTAKPQAIGGQWDGDPAKLAEQMGHEVPVSAEHTRVTTRLVSVRPLEGGGQAEVIEWTLTSDPLAVGKDMGGLTVAGGAFTGTVKRTVPVDTSKPVAESDEHMTLKVNGTAQGGMVTADVALERTVHRTAAEKK